MEIGTLATSVGGPRKRNWVEIVNAARAGTGKASVAKTGKKVATAEDRLGKKTVASGLRDSLSAATANSRTRKELDSIRDKKLKCISHAFKPK